MNFRRALQLEHVYFQRTIAVSSLLCHKILESAVPALTDPEFWGAVIAMMKQEPPGVPDGSLTG